MLNVIWGERKKNRSRTHRCNNNNMSWMQTNGNWLFLFWFYFNKMILINNNSLRTVDTMKIHNTEDNIHLNRQIMIAKRKAHFFANSVDEIFLIIIYLLKYNVWKRFIQPPVLVDFSNENKIKQSKINNQLHMLHICFHSVLAIFSNVC